MGMGMGMAATQCPLNCDLVQELILDTFGVVFFLLEVKCAKKVVLLEVGQIPEHTHTRTHTHTLDMNVILSLI